MRWKRWRGCRREESVRCGRGYGRASERDEVAGEFEEVNGEVPLMKEELGNKRRCEGARANCGDGGGAAAGCDEVALEFKKIVGQVSRGETG